MPLLRSLDWVDVTVSTNMALLTELPGRAEEVFEEVYVDLAAEALPGKAAPGFGNDVDVAVGIHVAGLQFMTAKPLIEEDALSELPVTEIFPAPPDCGVNFTRAAALRRGPCRRRGWPGRGRRRCRRERRW